MAEAFAHAGAHIAIIGHAQDTLRETAEALAKAIPMGRTEVLEGQTHDVAPDVIAPALEKFFSE